MMHAQGKAVRWLIDAREAFLHWLCTHCLHFAFLVFIARHRRHAALAYWSVEKVLLVAECSVRSMEVSRGNTMTEFRVMVTTSVDHPNNINTMTYTMPAPIVHPNENSSYSVDLSGSALDYQHHCTFYYTTKELAGRSEATALYLFVGRCSTAGFVQWL